MKYSKLYFGYNLDLASLEVLRKYCLGVYLCEIKNLLSFATMPIPLDVSGIVSQYANDRIYSQQFNEDVDDVGNIDDPDLEDKLVFPKQFSKGRIHFAYTDYETRWWPSPPICYDDSSFVIYYPIPSETLTILEYKNNKYSIFSEEFTSSNTYFIAC
jgi:hypothetical protein